MSGGKDSDLDGYDTTAVFKSAPGNALTCANIALVPPLTTT